MRGGRKRVDAVTGTATGPGQQAGRAELLELDVGEAAHGGWCVARDPAGRVVFVRHALPGERVRAQVTDRTARFARAEATEILRASPDRVEPPCPHARPGGCGGCDWQHASLAAQRQLKAAVVRHQLRRIAGLDCPVTVEPVAGDAGGLGWRTRVRYSVGPDGSAGLLRHRSHEVVPVGECPIAHPLVNAAGVTGQRWPGARSVEVVVSPGTGDQAVIVTGAGGRRGRPVPGRTVPGRPVPRQTVHGRDYLRQLTGGPAGRSWRVSAGTFWQVHPGAAEALTGAVLAALEPQPGAVALDLYCGAGLFAGALAAAVGPSGTVIGVESDRAAARDARHNLRRSAWARVHCGDAVTVLAMPGLPAPGLAVLDPPRAGAARPVIDRLASWDSLRRIAYVSCDPATLARDLAVFAGAGWRLAGLRAFDTFPMTHHVECVAALVPG
jgi:tRNA/tmRNA/rRNA uracil-C5-methylase (TrmA/RlmC/RlmD family)